MVLLAAVCWCAALPQDCDSDFQSLLSFSGGPYSYGKPFECARQPSRHWCLLSLASNYSSLNPFFSSSQPMGLCVPRSCNVSDVVSFVSTRLPSLPAVTAAYCWPDDPAYNKRADWTAGGAVVVAVFLLLLTAVVVVTCVLEYRPQAVTSDSVALLGVNEERGGAAGRDASLWCVFDARAAVAELASEAPPSLRALDLMRVVSIALVVLGHVLVFNVVFFDNPLDVFAETSSGAAALLVTAALGFRAVDTFFFLGALLLSFVVVRRTASSKRLGGWRAVVFLVASRVLRVVPLYYFVLLVWFQVVPMIAAGPVAWRVQHEMDKCGAAWWANLLFLNNFLPPEYGAMCMGWSWYLAVDMQLFVVLGPPLLALLVRMERLWLFVALVAAPLCLAAMGYSLYFALQLGYMVGEYSTYVYSKPYARMVPFVLGLATGGLLARHSPSSVKLPWHLTALLHTLALAAFGYCAVAHLFVVVDPAAAGSFVSLAAWSVSYSVLYAVVWSAMLMWLVFSCYHRLLPSLIQGPMEWRLWTVLGRLGFGIYLVHPVILHAREYGRIQLPAMTVVWVLDNFLAVFFASVCVAFVLYVVVEYPASALVKRLLPSAKK